MSARLTRSAAAMARAAASGSGAARASASARAPPSPPGPRKLPDPSSRVGKRALPNLGTWCQRCVRRFKGNPAGQFLACHTRTGLTKCDYCALTRHGCHAVPAPLHNAVKALRAASGLFFNDRTNLTLRQEVIDQVKTLDYRMRNAVATPGADIASPRAPKRSRRLVPVAPAPVVSLGDEASLGALIHAVRRGVDAYMVVNNLEVLAWPGEGQEDPAPSESDPEDEAPAIVMAMDRGEEVPAEEAASVDEDPLYEDDE